MCTLPRPDPAPPRPARPAQLGELGGLDRDRADAGQRRPGARGRRRLGLLVGRLRLRAVRRPRQHGADRLVAGAALEREHSFGGLEAQRLDLRLAPVDLLRAPRSVALVHGASTLHVRRPHRSRRAPGPQQARGEGATPGPAPGRGSGPLPHMPGGRMGESARDEQRAWRVEHDRLPRLRLDATKDNAAARVIPGRARAGSARPCRSTGLGPRPRSRSRTSPARAPTGRARAGCAR